MKTTYRTLTIGQTGLKALTEKIDALNARAAKLGLEPVTVETIKTVEYVAILSKGNFALSTPLYTVAVVGVEPCVNGWRMVGKIEFDPDLGNIVKTIGETELDVRYRTLGCICVHCNSQRKRQATFILRHDSGQEKVVGRNCLADFIREGDAETLASYAEFIDGLHRIADGEGVEDDDCGDYCGYHASNGPAVRLVDYLAMVSCVIRKFGWTSKTAAKENEWLTPTTDYVGRCYFGSYKSRMKFVNKNELFPTEKDVERAVNALEWAKTQLGQREDYLNTIGQIAQAEIIHWRYDGFTASIIGAYDRAKGREVERAKANLERAFIGEVGKRLRDLPVTISRVRFTEGAYGTKTIITMETPVDGKRAVMTWFASGDKDEDFSEGDSLVVDATVKKHESHETFGDSTIVSRVTVKGKQCQTT